VTYHPARIAARHSFFLARCLIAAASVARLRRKLGFRTLRCGSGVVATPMTLDAGKEDVGKGGASPAPLPKILASYRDKPRSGLRRGFVRGAAAIGRGRGNRAAGEPIVAGNQVMRESCLPEEQK
jgi:hypothetical protein